MSRLSRNQHKKTAVRTGYTRLVGAPFRRWHLLVFVAVFALLGTVYFLFRGHAATPTNHFVGVYSVDSASDMGTVAADGIDSVLNYGANYTGTDSYSTTVKANNMKIIDAMPWEYLYWYENKTNGITTTQQLMSAEAAHLQAEQNNSLISSYYLLDDWTFGDGTAKTLLQQITALIHQYTPGKPGICGFGGSIVPGPPNTDGWTDPDADNFSPQGCDMIGLYIYADSGTNGPSYDWAMSKQLPAVLASFTQRGWNIASRSSVFRRPSAAASKAKTGTCQPPRTWRHRPKRTARTVLSALYSMTGGIRSRYLIMLQ